MNTLDAAARVAEERGFEVVAKYMAVSTRQYCKYKYGADLISEEHRLAMCNLVSTPTDEVNCHDQHLAFDMNKKHHYNRAHMFLVSGADKGSRNYTNGKVHRITVEREGYDVSEAETMPGDTLAVSATEIRNVFAELPLEEAIEKLKGILPDKVREYILQHPESVIGMQGG